MSVVSIPKGAAVWIVKTGDDAVIYDFHDSLRTGRPIVLVNGKALSLAPGTEMFITRSGKVAFEELNSKTMIDYHNVRVTELGAGARVFTCTFSIAQGLARNPIVSGMLNSKDAAQKKMAWKLIKDATILADLTGSSL